MGTSDFLFYVATEIEGMNTQTIKKTEVSVSLNSSLLKAIDECAEQLRYNREEFIAMACQQFIGQISPQELENIYCERQMQQPEELQWAETAAILAGEILPKEKW
jgi:predicted transcriptional regulator